ncbi:unnamed protein product [Closterium sp. NIES-53]
MEVSHTSMIHAAAPHFMWPFAVRYTAHQLNLWPRVSLLETSPTLRWTGEVGGATVFRVWGSRAFVRDSSADKLSACAIPCVFLGFPPDAPGWQFYHPTSRRVLSSQDVTFCESVPFYHLFPYRSAPPPPPPLFLAPRSPPVDPLLPQGPAPSSAARGTASGGAASGGAEPGGAESEDTGSGGAEPGGAEPGGTEPTGVEPGDAESEGVEPGGAESEGAESGGAEPWGAASSGGPAGASPRLSPRPEPLSPQQLCEWLVWRAHLRSGAAGAGATRSTRVRGAKVTTGTGGTRGITAVGRGGARTRGIGAAGTGGVGGAGAGDPTEPGVTGAGGTGAGGAGAGGAGAGGSGAGGIGAGGAGAGGTGAGGAGARGAGAGGTDARGAARWRFFVPRLLQALLLPICVRHHTKRSRRYSQPQHCLLLLLTLSSPAVLQSVMSLHLVLSHLFALLVAFLVLLSSAAPDPEFDLVHAASPTVSRLLATVVTDPSFESTASSALVAELLDFAAACLLDNATALVAESESASHPSVGGECALGTDVLEDRQEDFECLAAAVTRFASMLLAPEGDPDAPDIPTPRSYEEAITVPYSYQWQAAMDAKMASWKSTGTYVDAIPPFRANIVDGMWIFRVKRPPGSPPAFKARYVARGFRHRQGVDYLQTFSPTPKMTTLRVLLHIAAQRDYGLHSLDFSTAFLQGSLYEEIWTTLAALGFAPSTADPSLFLRTDTSVPSFYVLVYVDNLVFAAANTEALTLVKSELQKRHTCTDLGPSALQLLVLLTTAHSSVYRPHALSSTFGRVPRYVAPGRHRKVHWDAAKRVLRYLCSTSGMGLVLGGRGPVVLTGHADASWANDSATQRSSQDNKAMTALCQEHRLEHRMKHIALRYFLARDLQQRGRLRLAYVATRANNADMFTKALPPGDHQQQRAARVVIFGYSRGRATPPIAPGAPAPAAPPALIAPLAAPAAPRAPASPPAAPAAPAPPAAPAAAPAATPVAAPAPAAPPAPAAHPAAPAAPAPPAAPAAPAPPAAAAATPPAAPAAPGAPAAAPPAAAPTPAAPQAALAAPPAPAAPPVAALAPVAPPAALAAPPAPAAR